MQLLIDKGKKPNDIALALGKTERAVYQWLSGKRTPRFTVLEMQKLCTELNCSVFDLPTDFSRS